MLRTIEGIYKNCKIKLAETPQGITENRVFVTFLETISMIWPETIMQHQGVVKIIIVEFFQDKLLPANEFEF
ncbi:hypothetical protein [uncultured Nostoc sp.]|uniref:hypothetical protein n=1 Tax=uncultured Nostoc sp. TaxID=340711 RepID=UPI0035CA23C2